MLTLHNTLTQKTEPFQSAEPFNVKMYSCGPSTYQPAHIGNYRTFLFEDVLQRYLEYLCYHVTRVMTLTDVEDKAIQQARKENLTIEELTLKNETLFFRDFELLKIKKPDYPVRASTATDQAVNLIIKLIEGGYAYYYNYGDERNVYFDALKFEGFGKLARLDVSKWPKKKRRFHQDTYPGTPWNLGDFVLWHGCKQANFCYDTSIGSGRPAWNIQDAALVTKTLGFTIDVACGGIDNLVRHHDYTLSIAEAVSGKSFSRFWLHGAHLFVDGKKMSKSRRNVYYPCDLTAKGFSGAQIRFFLIYGHYRKEINFTWDKIRQTSQKLDSLQKMVQDLQEAAPSGEDSSQEALTSKLNAGFEEKLNNDLDIKGAFDWLYETVIQLHRKRGTLEKGDLKNVLSSLRRIDSVFQCIF
jgi:cysteinyl-tRNA synthetase